MVTRTLDSYTLSIGEFLRNANPVVSLLRPIPLRGKVEQCNNHLQKGWETVILFGWKRCFSDCMRFTPLPPLRGVNPFCPLSPRHIEIIKGVIWQNAVLTFLHLVEALQKLNERSQNRLDETGSFEVINDFTQFNFTKYNNKKQRYKCTRGDHYGLHILNI